MTSDQVLATPVISRLAESLAAKLCHVTKDRTLNAEQTLTMFLSAALRLSIAETIELG